MANTPCAFWALRHPFFKNLAGGTITAADRTVDLTKLAGSAPTIVFENGGTIRATSATASHVVHFDGFSGALDFTNSGTIFSSGEHAVFADNFQDNPSLEFDNSGTLQSASGPAVELLQFASAVTVDNSGTIQAGGVGHALTVDAGDHTDFENSGTISANDGRAVLFQNFPDPASIIVASGEEPSFTNLANGRISAASGSFYVDSSFDYDNPYRFTNNGEVSATDGSYAVYFGDREVTFVNAGTITSLNRRQSSWAVGSTVRVTGTITAGGTFATSEGLRPVAILLGASGSTIRLEDGANVIGDIAVASGTAAPASGDRHQVLLQGVTNASYYFDFPEDYFVFKINDEVQAGGSGFSPATTIYTALPVLHHEHAKMHRKNFRGLSKFPTNNSFKSLGFSGSSDADKTTQRNAKVSGDRNGFVQSVQQSVFDLFDAELIFATGNGSYSVDNNIFTVGQDYTGFGLGLSNVLSLGPFSLSAMAMSGISENSVSRLVYSNTADSGFFRVNSSFDTTHVDAVYEAVLDFRVYGPAERLTRRKPYRVAVELGFGGSLHTALSDGFAEGSYISTAKNTTESNATGGRVKVELEFRNPFDRRHIFGFLELENTTADITKGNSYAYTVDNDTDTSIAPALKATNSVISAGMVFDIDEDRAVSFAYSSTDGSNETESTRANLSFKWRF